MRIHMHIHMHIHTHMHMRIHMHMHMHIHIHMHMHMHIHIHTHIHIHMHIHMHIHIQRSLTRKSICALRSSKQGHSSSGSAGSNVVGWSCFSGPRREEKRARGRGG
jgi:hypothetical protein